MRALALLLAVTTVLAIDFQCDLQNSTSQLFPHDTDARKYYVCDENHKLIESVCPDESVFNKVLRICDKAESASSGRSTCPNGSVKPDTDRRKFSICISNSWRTRECPNGHVFSTDKVACVRDSSASPQNLTPSKECKQGELKADGTSPNKYFICVNNVWRSQVCPSGLAFNTQKQLCALMIKDDVTTNSKVTKECKQGELKADGTNPNKYFTCENNVWRSQACPSGQVFNTQKQLCALVIKEDGTTNSKVTKDTCENGCVQQNPNCCDRFYLCVGGVWTNQACQPGHYFDPKRRACVVDVFGLCKVATPKPPPGCTENCVKQDPHDCKKYLICKNGIWEQRTCPNGQYFDTSKNACVVDVWGTCIPQTKPPPTKCTDGCVKQDPECCDKYYVCSGGIWVRTSCPKGQYFEPSRQACIVDTWGVCVEKPTPPACTEDCVKQDPHDCTRYLICKNGIWEQRTCPNGQYFDNSKNACVVDVWGTCIPQTKPPPTKCTDGCVKQDPECCDKYYVCSGGIWVRTSCPKGQYFEPSRQACIVDTWGVCVEKPTPPACTEDCVKQDPHDCTRYLICKNGIWEQRTCPNGQYFDTSKNACVVDVWGTCIPQTTPPPTKCTDGCVKQDPECCDKYYVCSGGIWVRTSCPAGQYFEPSRQACIVDVNGVCTSATVAPQDCDGSSHGSMKPDKVCNKFWLCLFGLWRPQSCDPGKMFDADKNLCVPDDGTCLPKPPKCEEGCVKQDPECCDKYYVCSGGIWVRTSCPKGQYFEPSRQACIVDTWGVCVEKPTPPACTEDCVKQDPHDCTRYLICKNGIWEQRTCPNGQYFDTSKNACVVDVWGTCIPQTTPPPTECTDGCVKQDPECCDKYYVCSGGIWVRTSCPKGQYFEPSRQACIVDTWGVCVEKPTPPACTEDCVKQDPHDCTRYLICKNGIWEQRTCPNGQYFDTSKNACVVDVWGTCIPQTTPPPTKCTDGCVKQDPECCDKYYVCSGGIWVRTSCPAGQYFEPSRQACIVDVNGVCTSATVAPQDCDGSSHGSMKPDKVCNKFWLCLFGLWRPQSCDPGKMFDADKNLCVPDDGTCLPKPPKCEEGCVKQDPECCDKYYVCSGGIWVRTSCPKGQYFEPSRQACIVDTWGVCVEKPTPPACTEDCVKQDPHDCTRYLICKNGIWEQRTCPNGQYFDTSKNACVVDVWGTCIPQTKPPPTKCTDGCVKQDPECCDKYYVCSGGIWVRTSCPAGQYFEPSRQACIVDVNGVCTSATVAPQDCDGSSHGSMKPDKVCNKFWLCLFGLWRPQSCDPGKMFDADKNLCVPDDGTCLPKPPKCEEGCVKQDPECCDKYYVCSGGIWVRTSCPKGQYFEPSRQACIVDTWGVCVEKPTPPACTEDCVKQDPHDCTKYLICKNGIWEQRSCPSGQYFDTSKNACVLDVWGTCIPQTKPPPTECTNGCVKQDPNCCDRYFSCVDGRWIRVSCPAGQYFDPKRQACIVDVFGLCKLRLGDSQHRRM